MSAYWFNTSTGQLIEVAKQYHSHINAVIAAPQTFSLTLQFIKDLYGIFDESLGYEGHAREEILKVILRETAWVRIRHHEGRDDRWSVDVGAKADRILVEEQLEILAPKKYGHRIFCTYFDGGQS